MPDVPPAPGELSGTSADLSVGRMHYLDEGSGPVILFVHGTPTSSYDWRHVIRNLRGRARCVAPDLIGFGQSARPRDFAYSPEAHARVLAEWVDRLKLDRFTLVVHDFGGPIGLPLCLDSPKRVERLVLINTWMWPFDDDPDMTKKARVAGGAMGRLLYKYMNFSQRVLMPSAYGDRRKLTRELHQHFLDEFKVREDRVLVLHALARALLGSRDFYASLWQRVDRLRGRPTGIIWGMKDSAFQPHLLVKWRQALPDAVVTTIDGAGHWPHEEAPAEVTAAIAGVLSAAL